MTDRFLGLCLAAMAIAAPATAHAYLDAGTGSMLLQIILAGVAGLMVATRIFWRRVRALFAGSAGEQATGESDVDQRDGDQSGHSGRDA